MILYGDTAFLAVRLIGMENYWFEGPDEDREFVRQHFGRLGIPIITLEEQAGLKFVRWLVENGRIDSGLYGAPCAEEHLGVTWAPWQWKCIVFLAALHKAGLIGGPQDGEAVPAPAYQTSR